MKKLIYMRNVRAIRFALMIVIGFIAITLFSQKANSFLASVSGTPDPDIAHAEATDSATDSGGMSDTDSAQDSGGGCSCGCGDCDGGGSCCSGCH